MGSSPRHVIVNALSATNTSAKIVLRAHLREFVRVFEDRIIWHILTHAANEHVAAGLGPHVVPFRCPDRTASWPARTLWEAAVLPHLVKRLRADLYYSPSGSTSPRVPVPQIILAQNVWSLACGVPEGWALRRKADLQRWSYRRAMKRAYGMAFNSEFTRTVYRQAAGCIEQSGCIAYHGIDDELLHQTALMERTSRSPFELLSVSEFAPHKRVETLFETLVILRERHGVPATLTVVGGCSDGAYRTHLHDRMASLGLKDAVRLLGELPRSELAQHYARARVFCLLSACESFSFPSVEAQIFGLPVVVPDTTAFPEVCGDGALFARDGQPEAAAEAIHSLLTDDVLWRRVSEAAVNNAARFRWETCLTPLVDMIRASVFPDRAEALPDSQSPPAGALPGRR